MDLGILVRKFKNTSHLPRFEPPRGVITYILYLSKCIASEFESKSEHIFYMIQASSFIVKRHHFGVVMS